MAWRNAVSCISLTHTSCITMDNLNTMEQSSGMSLEAQVAKEEVSAPCPTVEPVSLELALFFQIAREMVKLDLLEDADNETTLDILIGDYMKDYPDNDRSEMAQYSAKIARASIADQTRYKHIRCMYPSQNALYGFLMMPKGSSKPFSPTI